MLTTILTKMQHLRQGQWLVLIGVLVMLASASSEFAGISLLKEYADRIFNTGLAIIIGGVSLMIISHKSKKGFSLDTLTNSMLEYNERQYTILDQHPRSFYETDSTGRVTYVNKAYVSLTGRAVSEIEGSNWALTVHPDDRRRVMSEWASSIENHRRFETEYVLVRHDGDERVVRNQASPMEIDGPPFGWIGLVEELEDDDHEAD